MTDIDHLYDKVAKGDPNKEELLEIIDIVANSTSFNNSSFSVNDLFLKISNSKHTNDKMIELMYQIQVDGFGATAQQISKLLDNGSKGLFDKIWGDKNTHGKWILLWKSKHTDTKQLEAFWNGVLKNPSGVDKNWIQSVKNAFFRHPNAPTKILNRQLKNKDSLLNLALNPNLSGKAFEAVCMYAKVQRHDGIFENLVRNTGVDWEKIADGIDLKMQIKSMMGGGIMSMSEKRKEVMMDFFLRPDCPDDVKAGIYKLIPDERLLPQAAKDLFLF